MSDPKVGDVRHSSELGTERYEEWSGVKWTLHREGGPALIRNYGEVSYWYKNGRRHREGGPAVIYKHAEAWYINDVLHRDDGPALVTEGQKQYFLAGQEYEEKDFLVRTTLLGKVLYG
jgi:hypothetical protein